MVYNCLNTKVEHQNRIRITLYLGEFQELFLCEFLLVMFFISVSFYLSIAALCYIMSSSSVNSFQGDHLIVLSHGINGNRHDLTYLSQKLEESGCMVLLSKINEYLNSYNGIRIGGDNLAQEVRAVTSSYPQLRRISFVGNSLGGLYARYAVRVLFNPDTKLIAGLIPFHFLVS